MIKEGNVTVTNCDTLKMIAKDGKYRDTDILDTEGIFRLIESVPSPKAEPFKLWLAKIACEKLESELDESIITKDNNLNYKYLDEPKE